MPFTKSFVAPHPLPFIPTTGPFLRTSTVCPLSTPRRSSLSSVHHRRTIAISATANATKPLHTHNTSSYCVRSWTFKSFCVQYAESAIDSAHPRTLPAMVLVHGFGANCEHWRNNLQPLAATGFRVYALDLLGFGMGDKPAPGSLDSNGQPVEYTFDYWTQQLSAFIDDVVEPDQTTPVFLVANSIGCMVTMQYALQNPSRCMAQVFISPSLRQLNVRKRSWVQSLTSPVLMSLLSYRPLGAFFLDSLARPKQLRNVLLQAYGVTDAVDDELIRIIGDPGKTHGALEVFLSFIMYDYGPIPEDFLPELIQPALIIWGEEDQFEPFELGQALRHYSIVESFVGLPGVGHCAHDESPDKCNELISQFAAKHVTNVQ